MKKITMESYEFILNEDLGIKGFEHLFQEKIEDCLKANEMDQECWWEILPNESIFGSIKIIYDGEKVEILANLVEYYEKIKDTVHLILEIEDKDV